VEHWAEWHSSSFSLSSSSFASSDDQKNDENQTIHRSSKTMELGMAPVRKNEIGSIYSLEAELLDEMED